MTNGQENMSHMINTKDDLDKRMQQLSERVEMLTRQVDRLIEEEQRKNDAFYQCLTIKNYQTMKKGV